MHRILSAVVVCCLASLLFAQDAADFTVKDIDGKEHHLYSYLEAGKWVLIDFWATW